MMQYLWLLLALCGLGMIVYGLFLFFAMPAAGVFVAVAGLMFFSIASRGKRRNDMRSSGETAKEERTNCKREKRSNRASSAAGISSTRAPISSSSCKIAGSMLFFTNMILISSIIPRLRESLGSDIGHMVGLVLTFTATLFYSGLTFSFFRTVKSIALVVLLTWVVIIVRAVR